MMKVCIFLLLTGLVSAGANASCTVTMGIPTASEAGDVMRNPVQGPSTYIGVPVSVSCQDSGVSVSLSSSHAAFVNSLSPTLSIPFKVSASGLANGVGGNLTSITPNTPILLGDNSGNTFSFTLYLSPSAIGNLQPGTYSESLIITTKTSSSTQDWPFTVSGIVPDDCAVSLGSAPDPLTLGTILKSPILDSFSVDVSIQCKTYKAKVSLKALNGYFKGSATNTKQIPYQIQLTGTSVEGSTLNSSDIVGSWVSAGSLLVNTAATAALVITPAIVQDVPPDTYNETVYILVNGP